MNNRMKTSAALFTSFVLLATAPAQTAAQQKADPFRFVPADAQIVMRIGAPARWQQHFAGTKVAKLLASEAFAPWLEKFHKGFDEGLEHARTKGKLDIDVVQQFLKDYRGELVLALHFDLESVKDAIANEKPPKFWCSVDLTPDASFDLATLAATLTKGIEEDQGTKLRDVAVGEHRLRGHDSDGVTVTVPALLDGHLVMLVSNDLETSGTRVLGTGDRMAAAGDGTALWAHVDLHAVMPLLVDAIADRASEAGAPVDVKPVLRDIGLLALESLSTSIRANGDRTESEFGVGTTFFFTLEKETENGENLVSTPDPAGRGQP